VKKDRAKVVAPNTTRRDILITIIGGLFALGIFVWGIAALWKTVPHNTLTGTILAKHFTPQPEEQITIGKSGLSERKLDGEYRFDVRADRDGKTYTVWVDKRDFEARKIGDKFQFSIVQGSTR